MKISCPYCGRTHEKNYECGKKPKRPYHRYKKNNAPTKLDSFRWSGAWKVFTEEIKERDNYLCQSCLHELIDVMKRIKSDGLSVHHIEPLESAWQLRLEPLNCITLCSYCHGQAEQGNISPKVLKNIAEYNQNKFIDDSGRPPAYVF